MVRIQLVLVKVMFIRKYAVLMIFFYLFLDRFEERARCSGNIFDDAGFCATVVNLFCRQQNAFLILFKFDTRYTRHVPKQS